jgi:DNA-binding transcriptional regulator YiaG
MNITNIEFRLWRKKNKLTQAQVADYLGCTTRTINNWECKGFPKQRNAIQSQMVEALVNGEIEIS